MDAIIGLGTNLGEREENLLRATALIEEQVGAIGAKSKLYETAPLVPEGSSAQGVPNYLNAAILVKTELTPEAVLSALLAIERSLGRDRSQETRRWQSRIIDLDLLAYEDLTVALDTLIVPHPELHKRRFVLEPMVEVAPEWLHPLLRKTTRELLDALVDTP
ncbi:MAG: 2-amino-4-hydroxy-6-hydroxymethyldihydropteridine diphosphokinase [Bdellovibrionota bacterium]